MNPAFPPRSRLQDRRDESRIDRLSREWISLRMGTISGGGSSVAFGTYDFGVYATGGVAIPGTAGSPVVTMPPWASAGVTTGAMLFFLWSPSTSKMIVTDWTGAEIDDAVDLSDVDDWPWTGVALSSSASSSTNRGEARLAGVGTLNVVEFEMSSALAADATDYWTISAYLRAADKPQDIGVLLGSYSTQFKGIDAAVGVKLFDVHGGAKFGESDRIIVRAVATGSPNALIDATAWARISRNVK